MPKYIMPKYTERAPESATRYEVTVVERRSRATTIAWALIGALCAIPVVLAFLGFAIFLPLALIGLVIATGYALTRILTHGDSLLLSGAPLVHRLALQVEDLFDHDRLKAILEREVEPAEAEVRDIPAGVEVRITSADWEAAQLLQERAWALAAELREGPGTQPVTPLERQIAAHPGTVDVELDRLREGVRLRELASSPELVALLREHARAALARHAEPALR